MNISVRREIESYLFMAGLSLQEVAAVLDIHIGSAKNDYNALGGKSKFQTKLSPAERRSKTYAASLSLYAELIFTSVVADKSEEVQSGLKHALENYLDRRWMGAVADGVATTINLLCQPNDPIEYRGHRALLNAVLGKCQNQELSGREVLAEYLYRISSEKNIPPGRTAFAKSMALWAIEQYRKHFSMPLGEEVVRAIDCVLETLLPVEREILCMRLGIGREKMSIYQISEHYSVSRERIRQVEHRVFRKLRHPSRSHKLRGFVSAQEAASNYLQNAFPAPLTIEIPEISVDNLNKRVEELETSIRLYNCLSNLEIRYVYQVVEKTEDELLKSKNFSRRLINELKELLAGMNLSLGMTKDM